LLSLVVCVW